MFVYLKQFTFHYKKMTMTIYELITRVETDFEFVNTHFDACRSLRATLNEKIALVEQKRHEAKLQEEREAKQKRADELAAKEAKKHRDWAKTLPEIPIGEKLEQWFEEYCDNKSLDEEARHFLIQYSAFEQRSSNEWLMYCIVPQTGGEGIYSFKNVEFAENETEIEFESWKHNYDENVILTSAVKERVCNYLGYQIPFSLSEYDKRGQSTPTCIYAIDLFPDVEPRHFKASCWTRGAAIEWNWITLELTGNTQL